MKPPDPPPAGAPAARALRVDPAASVVRYRIVHMLHRVEGRTSAIEARAVLEPDGRVAAAALVPVATFRSGDDDRDARTFEILGRFVTFKGEARLPPGEARARVPLRGDLTLRGAKRPLTATLDVELAADGSAHVRGAFEVSLEAHGVERPSLLFVKIEDAVRVDVDLTLRPEAPGAGAGRA